jgi:hypothetical protein
MPRVEVGKLSELIQMPDLGRKMPRLGMLLPDWLAILIWWFLFVFTFLTTTGILRCGIIY